MSSLSPVASVRRVAARGLLLVAWLLGGLVWPTASVDAASASCADVMPTDEIRPGMTGHGLTVSSGTEVERFDVEVLGVISDGLAPGRDVIVVDTASPAIERAGGLWAGMSGSPVYVRGKLIGAVALNFSLGPSSIGGLTAAEDMADLYTSRDASSAVPRVVTVDDGLRATIADRTGLSVRQVPSDLRRMPLPLGLSGIPTRLVDGVQERIDRSGAMFVPHLGGGGGVQGGERTLVRESGGNLAAVVAQGDLTVAALGTITDVCDDVLLGFAHPMLHTGGSTLAASTADVIAVVDDPIFGSLKLGEVAEPFGAVEQDRQAGIRAAVGDVPSGTAVTSMVRAVDGGTSREGHTSVFFDDWLGDLALSHVVANIDVTQDRLGGGSALVAFTVSGTRASGGEWILERQNRSASVGDIAFDATTELLLDVLLLQHNVIEPVEITAIDVSVDVAEAPHRYTLTHVLVAVDGAQTWTDAPEVVVPAGGRLLVRSTLRDVLTGEQRDLEQALDVPEDAGGAIGVLEVRGGLVSGDPWLCQFDPAACAVADTTSLDDLISSLAEQPRRDDLVAALVLDTAVDPVEGGGPLSQPAAAQVTTRLDQVIEGTVTRSVVVDAVQ